MPTTALNPLYDNHMDSLNPGLNNDASVTIATGEHFGGGTVWRTLMKFDLTSIPPGSQIASATLTLVLVSDYSNNARTLRVYRCRRNWSRLNSCWTNYDAALPWATAGADGALDREATDIGNIALGPAEAVPITKVITLSTIGIQTVVDGAFVNNGFVLRMDTENDDAYWEASLEAVAPGNRPLLTIVWTPPLGRLPAYIVDGLQGGVTLKATVEQFANETWARHTPVGGALTRTPAAHSIDLASQAKFGRKDQPLSGGAASVTIADQISDTYLSFQSTPNMPDITLAPGTVIKDQNGNVVPPEEIRPNNWMLIENLALPTSAVFSSLTANPMALYLEEVTFDSANGLQITAGRDRFTQALVARIAGRGGG